MKSENTGDVFDASHTIFSQNQKISPRQIRRALTLELFGVSSLLLPSYLAGAGGISGIAALCIGAAGAWLLVYVWDRLSDHCDFEGENIPADNHTEKPCAAKGQRLEKSTAESTWTEGRGGYGAAKRIMRRIILAVSGIGLLALASGVLYLLTVLLRDQLLTERYEAAIVLTLTAAGVFGLQKGLESRIRIYEVLFWFLLVPLVFMLILACFSVHPRYWTQTSFSASGFWKSCWISFLFFSIVSLILFFKPHCSVPKQAAPGARRSILLALMLNAAVYLILVGIFQDSLLSELQFPVILLMAVVKLPGNFFERQDAFMVGIWFFCLFALFHSLLYYGSKALKNALCLPKQRTSTDGGSGEGAGKLPQNQTGMPVTGVICGAAVLVGGLWLLRHEELAGQHMIMMLCLTGSVLLLLPFLYFGICQNIKTNGFRVL